MHSSALLLQIICWLPFAYILLLWRIGRKEDCIKLAKYAFVFLLGVNAAEALG
ncbi:MAG: hypothetical protein V1494_05240 [Candidatus Diapherotrites archaeon]